MLILIWWFKNVYTAPKNVAVVFDSERWCKSEYEYVWWRNRFGEAIYVRTHVVCELQFLRQEKYGFDKTAHMHENISHEKHTRAPSRTIISTDLWMQ